VTIIRADRAATWYRRPRPVPHPLGRLVCFGPAGSAASFFNGWVPHLPPSVELLAAQLPGREDRVDEPPVEDLPALADVLAEALVPNDRPLVLFGHSLGAVLAYEVACRLEALRATGVGALCVSGRPAPGHERDDRLHQADDDALWADVRRLGGTEAEVLDHPALRELLLPVVRSDYRLSETYVPPAGPRLRCRVAAVIGDRDPEVTADEAKAWQDVTGGPFTFAMLPGGHFYLRDPAALGQVLVRGPLAPFSAWPSTP
jgi:pyochelin biosynthesis protein PchC